MEIQAKSVDRKLLLRFSGELDHHGAKTAIRELAEAVASALPLQLVLAFSGVTSLLGLSLATISGIAVLLRAQRSVQNLGGSVIVCRVPRQAKRVMDAAGIGRLMTIQAGGTDDEK